MAMFPIQTRDQRTVLGISFSFSVLAVVAVSLRLTAHAVAKKRWTPSDYLLIAACTFAVSLQSISITGVFQAGIGYGHVTDITLEYGVEPITKLLQLLIPLQFLRVLSLSCTKMSILHLYRQIFPILPWVIWGSYVTASIVLAWTVAAVLTISFACRPFAFNWDKTIPGGKCSNQVTSLTATAVVNLVTDVMVLLLPMRPLYKLQMATYKKVTLFAVFGLGIFTCVISALRISVLSTMDFGDITFTIPKVNIFTGLEPCLAVILASIPMMRPLFGRLQTTPYGSCKKPAETKPRSEIPKGVSVDGFERLDDETRHLWLRPVGGDGCANASNLRETVPEDVSEEDAESQPSRG
ncbi:integral membrane protein [Stemphylium lycopersici]|nr:integral membrane protein [Stemphylium lycopersici]